MSNLDDEEQLIMIKYNDCAFSHPGNPTCYHCAFVAITNFGNYVGNTNSGNYPPEHFFGSGIQCTKHGNIKLNNEQIAQMVDYVEICLNLIAPTLFKKSGNKCITYEYRGNGINRHDIQHFIRHIGDIVTGPLCLNIDKSNSMLTLEKMCPILFQNLKYYKFY